MTYKSKFPNIWILGDAKQPFRYLYLSCFTTCTRECPAPYAKRPRSSRFVSSRAAFVFPLFDRFGSELAAFANNGSVAVASASTGAIARARCLCFSAIARNAERVTIVCHSPLALLSKTFSNSLMLHEKRFVLLQTFARICLPTWNKSWNLQSSSRNNRYIYLLVEMRNW